MSIPREILDVERPKNTVVVAYGKNKVLYAVRKRIGCNNINGRHLPINGPTIGHIIDGKYVPIDEKKKKPILAPRIFDWADAELCERLFHDMIPELEEVYSHDDAMKLYAMAVLRVCNPDMKDTGLQEMYQDSFLSIYHPDIPLSKNTVSKFLSDIGKQLPMIYEFMQNRAKKAGNHHLLIDGILKNNDFTTINTLSDFSHKSRLNDQNNIPVLYAFDLEQGEPVCSLCFPGNLLDVTSYSDFIEKCGISNGIIIVDKGFAISAINEPLENKEKLHYLSPLKRSSLLISEYDMLTFEGILNNERENIQYKKSSISEGRFLYSFRDPTRALKEENDYLENRKKNRNYDSENYNKKRKSFGTIVFLSDINLTPEEVWKCYSSREEIELVMKFYQHALEYDDTDCSLYASEFVDFLSEILTCRLLNTFKQKNLLDTYTYSEILKILKKAKKIQIGKEWILTHINPSEEDVLKKLGLLESEEEQPKRKRGRPRKRVL